MNVLQRIKDLANERNISLAELERQTGLSSGSITKWGKSSPSSDKLEKIADYFNVTTDYILGRDTDRKRNLGAKGELLAAHIDDDVSEEDMKDILDYIEYRKNNPL